MHPRSSATSHSLAAPPAAAQSSGRDFSTGTGTPPLQHATVARGAPHPHATGREPHVLHIPSQEGCIYAASMGRSFSRRENNPIGTALWLTVVKMHAVVLMVLLPSAAAQPTLEGAQSMLAYETCSTSDPLQRWCAPARPSTAHCM